MNYRNLSHRKLLKLCAEFPPNERAWREFICRYDEFIKLCALRECRSKISSYEKKQLPEIVLDRVGEIYAKLVAKEHRALKNFVGKSENSIFSYLAIISKNVVKNWIIREKMTQSRPNIDRSLDQADENERPIDHDSHINDQTSNIENGINYAHLKHEINVILNSILKGKNVDRNKLIFSMHIYDGLTAHEIVEGLPYSMTLKTVQNIISDLKKAVHDRLTGDN